MPKTAEQERLQGYPGHRPVNSNAPVPDMTIPEPPKRLGRIAKRHYHDVARVVGPDKMRTMGASDIFALTAICEIYQNYRDCRDFLDKHGRYFDVFEDDVLVDSKRNPRVIDEIKYWDQYLKGLGKFGLTPYERQKVSTLSEDKPEQTREQAMTEKRKKAVAAAKKGGHIQAVVNE